MALALTSCGNKAPRQPVEPSGPEATDEPEPRLQSTAILGREPVANRVEVRHILIGWRDLAGAYGGAIDERARERSSEDAEKLIQELYQRIDAGESFEALMAEYSEDLGSAQSQRTIEVTPDAQLVLDFKRLSLRLRVGEVGIVQSPYGWHIIKRVG